MRVDPFFSAMLRRHWTVLGALLVLLLLTLLNQLWYQPTLRRHERATKQAEELGVSLTPEDMPAFLPPRLFALIVDNSMPAREAETMGAAGTLTGQLYQDISSMTAARGIRILSSEPGAVSQQPRFTQVRARVRLRCRYDQFLDLLQDLAASGKLFAVERFTIAPDGAGAMQIDLSLSRLFIKQDAKGS